MVVSWKSRLSCSSVPRPKSSSPVSNTSSNTAFDWRMAAFLARLRAFGLPAGKANYGGTCAKRKEVLPVHSHGMTSRAVGRCLQLEAMATRLSG
eukprot:935691-Pyramimonas_sp.AAC.1